MNEEQKRLADLNWKVWGSYVSDRQWGTVREDYSANGDAWHYTTHDMARSKAYRWGEEGIGGICNDEQLLCFAVSFWNKKDPILKEIYFGLSNPQGNHGEDVKELYYYPDATPTHSYMKMLYKYPQAPYPYQWLIDENKKRSRLQPEFELIDTGIFTDDNYFDVFIEYAKASPTDILIKITVHNRSKDEASLSLLPTLWFRNTWSFGYDNEKPSLQKSDDSVAIHHKVLGNYNLYANDSSEILFCENETNNQRLYNGTNTSACTKDGINNYIVQKDGNAINKNSGTKAAVHYDITIPPQQNKVVTLRLCEGKNENPFDDFETIFNTRISEADAFYADVQRDINDTEIRDIQRQAFAGMIWNKQFYYYDVNQWLTGDPAQVAPPVERWQGRNADWLHLNNFAIISMPDKWEYPWYALWDLAFHCVTFALIDAELAKEQLRKLTHEWFMQPAGQFPAYEWSFGDVNPPVQAWATFRVYKIDEKNRGGKGDIAFLETVFHKLIINFTWWVNKKDKEDNNIFEGGFLGLDNIGLFDRSKPLPGGAIIEQSDGTSWMAMFALNMMRIAMELALYNPVYQDLASKFFEHFLYIAAAINSIGNHITGLWDDEDEFYYDILRKPNGSTDILRVRNAVGLIPLFAVEVIDKDHLEKLPLFKARLNWFLNNRPHLADLVSRWQVEGETSQHMLSMLRGHRIKKILQRMLDETEFLSDHGIRALSKHYKDNPYQYTIDGSTASVEYTPGESTTDMFAGNSNWRGPVWMPINFLIVESLQRFHHYYGNDFKVECPTNSGNYLTLDEIAGFLTQRLASLFIKDKNGRRAIFGNNNKMQTDEHFKNYLLFFEYFHGDTGKGLGASHQTGWTGLIAKLLQPRRDE